MVWWTAPPRMPSPLVISSTMLGSVGDSGVRRHRSRQPFARVVLVRLAYDLVGDDADLTVLDAGADTTRDARSIVGVVRHRRQIPMSQ